MSEIFNIADIEYLQDKVREMYARTVAYRHLMKAGHVLKNKSKEERSTVLHAISYFTNEFINNIKFEEYKLSNSQIDRLLAVFSECIFEKVVVLNNAGIVKNCWGNILDNIVVTVYYQELTQIKNHVSLVYAYDITKMYVNNEYAENIRELFYNGDISNIQMSEAMNKSYISYLKPYIDSLSVEQKQETNDKKIFKTETISAIKFIALCFILNAILYFLHTVS